MDPRPKTPSDAAFKKMQETAHRVRTSNTAIELWKKVFSDQDRQHLGGDLETAYRDGGAVKMWMKLHGCTYVRAIIDIAYAVNLLSSTDRRWLLSESGELLDADAAFEDAIRNNDLVLNSHSREIYWKGELIKLDWSHAAKWNFMWVLATNGKAGLPIDHTMFGENKRPDYVSKTKSELTNQDKFPNDLADLIEPWGTGTQKLKVPAERIRLFEDHVGGEIREWTP